MISLKMISSAWTLQTFIRYTHSMGLAAFSYSDTPARFASCGMIVSSRSLAAFSVSSR